NDLGGERQERFAQLPRIARAHLEADARVEVGRRERSRRRIATPNGTCVREPEDRVTHGTAHLDGAAPPHNPEAVRARESVELGAPPARSAPFVEEPHRWRLRA